MLRLDVKTTRVEALDATVSEPVKFGYGVLGSVSQGGTIHFKFSQVSPGIWKTQETKLDVDGHVALVKNPSRTEHTERFDFPRAQVDKHFSPDFSTIAVRQKVGNAKSRED